MESPQEPQRTHTELERNSEIVVHGQFVPRSHIVDFLKYTVSPLSKTEPLGYRQFYDVLQEMHTPTGFIIIKLGADTSKEKQTKDHPDGNNFVGFLTELCACVCTTGTRFIYISVYYIRLSIKKGPYRFRVGCLSSRSKKLF